MRRIALIAMAAAVVVLMCDGPEEEELSGWVYGGELGYDPMGVPLRMGLNLGLDVFPNGAVYVASFFEYSRWPTESFVYYFNANGRYLGRWGGDITYFFDVAAGPSRGWVYVADGSNSRIRYYTPRGSFLGEWSVPNAPVRIAVSPSDGNIYVAAGDSIQYFTATGSSLGAWGTEGSGNGQFSSPWGVAVAPDTGYVYVADTFNDRIQYFTSTGSFLGKWGRTGSGDGEFDGPFGVAVSPLDGNVYVADKENHRIQYFTPEGTFAGKFGSYGLEEGDLRNPWGLRFNATGKRLYITGVPGPLLYFDYYD
jgi:tripartite motif-containing protein 71